MARRDEGYFSSKDGTRLFWRSVTPDGAAKAMVAVVHGYADHSGRFSHTLDALAERGFSTLAFDYRGHGRSDGQRAHVKRWDEYLEDMAAFYARVREAAHALPTFVLAHSHGALIATHWAAGRPEGLKGLLLTSPYYKIAFQPPRLTLLAARLVKSVMPGMRFANTLKPEQLSRDPAWQKATLEDPLYIGNTTPGWWFEHVAAQDRLAGLGPSMTVPMLMMMGTADPIASGPAARAFFDTVASADKTWKEYVDFRHELLNEVGKEQVIDDISRWILAHR